MQIITSKRRITVEHATARDEKLLDMGTYGCVVVVANQTFTPPVCCLSTPSPATNRTISAFRTLPRGKSERQTPGAGGSTWDFALGRGSGKMGFRVSLNQNLFYRCNAC